MARILIVGNATLDIVNSVDSYPHEDQEVRANEQQITRGGNAANTAVVLSQLGHQCSWAGTLADEPNGGMIHDDLIKHGILLDHFHSVDDGKVPTSYITLSRDTGSRTIVHYRDLPEYPAEAFAAIDLNSFDWLHFEGRNVAALKTMLERSKTVAPQLPISLEVEKKRPGMDELMPFADLLLFSRDYAERQEAKDGATFLQQIAATGINAMLTCTWGADGAFALDHDGQVYQASSYQPEQVIDTLGAGDVFNAGMIDQLLREETLESSLQEATRLAGSKCGIRGLKLTETNNL